MKHSGAATLLTSRLLLNEPRKMSDSAQCRLITDEGLDPALRTHHYKGLEKTCTG